MEGRERGKEGLEEVASPYYSVLHASELYSLRKLS